MSVVGLRLARVGDLEQRLGGDRRDLLVVQYPGLHGKPSGHWEWMSRGGACGR